MQTVGQRIGVLCVLEMLAPLARMSGANTVGPMKESRDGGI